MGGLNGMNGLGGGLFVAFGLWLGGFSVAAQAQDLVPSADGKLQIPAYWFKASSATVVAPAGESAVGAPATVAPDAPRPVAIGLHGCGGALDAKGRLNPIWQRYAAYFNAENIHFMMLDSFTPRGAKSICAIPNKRRNIHVNDRTADVFAAVQWIAQHPGMDASRILLVGWSHGAQTVLAANDASNPVVLAPKIRPKAAAAFYPGCFNSLQTSAQNPGYSLAAPLLVMAGEKDDWTPAHRCVELRDAVLKRQAATDQKVRFDLQIYPDSYHGFDSLTPVRTLQNIGNTQSGTATAGENPAARAAAHGHLFEFVAAQFGEPLLLSHEQRLKVPPAALPANVTAKN